MSPETTSFGWCHQLPRRIPYAEMGSTHVILRIVAFLHAAAISFQALAIAIYYPKGPSSSYYS